MKLEESMIGKLIFSDSYVGSHEWLIRKDSVSNIAEWEERGEVAYGSTLHVSGLMAMLPRDGWVPLFRQQWRYDHFDSKAMVRADLRLFLGEVAGLAAELVRADVVDATGIYQLWAHADTTRTWPLVDNPPKGRKLPGFVIMPRKLPTMNLVIGRLRGLTPLKVAENKPKMMVKRVKKRVRNRR